ncbi:MAG: hypothetical protein JWO92_2504 [Chitinophagaceae bacterium]|nr:hypothetical protein [Chitinophagaceae bacterium]
MPLSPYQLTRQKSKSFGESQLPKEKKLYQIPKVSDKKKQQLKDEKPDREKQNDWFEAIDKKECPYAFTHCQECGKIILKAFMRAAIAHVLPKKKNQFPSVATHENNYIILGAGCGCHNKYDKSWDDASQMKVWPLAVSKFLEIYPFIASKEKKNIPDILLQEISPVIIAEYDHELKSIIIK